MQSTSSCRRRRTARSHPSDGTTVSAVADDLYQGRNRFLRWWPKVLLGLAALTLYVGWSIRSSGSRSSPSSRTCTAVGCRGSSRSETTVSRSRFRSAGVCSCRGARSPFAWRWSARSRFVGRRRHFGYLLMNRIGYEPDNEERLRGRVHRLRLQPDVVRRLRAIRRALPDPRCSPSRSAGRLAGVDGVVGPVGLLVGVALVDARDTVVDVDELGHEPGLRRRHDACRGARRRRRRTASSRLPTTTCCCVASEQRAPSATVAMRDRSSATIVRGGRRRAWSASSSSAMRSPSSLHGVHCPHDSTARNRETPAATATRSSASSNTMKPAEPSPLPIAASAS